MSKSIRLICTALFVVVASAPSFAQARSTPITSSDPVADRHSGAPSQSTPAMNASEPRPVVVTGKRRHRSIFKRIGHFFSRLFHGKRKWYSTPSHRNHCKRAFRSYDPKTNSYRAYSGVRRRCVI